MAVAECGLFEREDASPLRQRSLGSVVYTPLQFAGRYIGQCRPFSELRSCCAANTGRLAAQWPYKILAATGGEPTSI